MNQFVAEAPGIMGYYTRGYTNANNPTDWQCDAVIPLSNRPEDRGFYIVTTLDKFFQLDLEQSKNGNGKPPKG